jgi:CheY-like chemotaxis protein
MNKTGALVIIEDDQDDQEIMKFVYKELGYPNEIIFFEHPKEALGYLSRKEVLPFLVMSDINMPGMDGYELREIIFADDVLRQKCIPYIFFTTSANIKTVAHAYELSVQGFFIKPNTIKEIGEVFRKIMEYWMAGVAPHGYGLAI